MPLGRLQGTRLLAAARGGAGGTHTVPPFAVPLTRPSPTAASRCQPPLLQLSLASPPATCSLPARCSGLAGEGSGPRFTSSSYCHHRSSLLTSSSWANITKKNGEGAQDHPVSLQLQGRASGTECPFDRTVWKCKTNIYCGRAEGSPCLARVSILSLGTGGARSL